MAGYNDTKDLIIKALMGRPGGTLYSISDMSGVTITNSQ